MHILEQLHEAQEKTVKYLFLNQKIHVEAFKYFADEDIPTPSVLIDLEEYTPGKTRPNGDQGYVCRFNFLCTLSSQTDNVEVRVRVFASLVAEMLDCQRWGLKDAVDNPENIVAKPALFSPATKGFETWSVTFDQTVYIKEPDTEACPFNGVTPSTVFLGWSPEIGAAHQDDYDAVTTESS